MYKLNPNLRDFWQTKARNKILYGGRASGKCLKVGTLVIMADGSLKAVEDVAVGEQVMGPDGWPRNVLSTCRGEDRMYTIHQSNGASYTVNSRHILSLRSSRETKPFNVEIMEYMSMPRRHRSMFRGYKYFPDKDSEISIERVGVGEYAGFALDGDHLFCLADGTVTHNSHDTAGFLVFLSRNYKLKVLCCRKYQNKIDESVKSLLELKIDEGGVRSEFSITNNSIKHKETGSEFIFYGIEKSINEIKSIEGVNIVWLEEANFVTKAQFEVLEPTLRSEGSEFFCVFNPGEITDFMWQNFVVNPPDDTIIRHFNYLENPFLSATMIKVIESAKKRMTEEEFAHVYLGEPRSGNDKAVIQYKYVEACIDAHIKLGWEPTGQKVIGFDVADDGDDTCATVSVYGNLAYDLDEWHGLEDQILKSSTYVWQKARDTGSSVIFDTIGVGAHCGSKFGELNEANGLDIIYEGFNAGSSVPDPDGIYMELPHMNILNKDHFSGAKSYYWAQVSERMRKTYEAVVLGVEYDNDDLISISSEMPQLNQLKVELSTPKKDVDMSGRFKVESKKDLRKRGIKSPNLADAFIMAFIKPERRAPNFLDMDWD